MNLMLNGGGSYQEPGTRHVENSPCRGRVISCFTLDYFHANPIQLHRIWNYYFQAQFHRIWNSTISRLTQSSSIGFGIIKS